MGIRFGTGEWAATLVEEINGSSEYRNAGTRWGDGFNGNLLFVFEPDEQLPQALHLLIRLRAGTCSGVEFVDDPEHPESGFRLVAPYELWRRVLERKTPAATAILTGKLQVHGEKMTLLQHTAAHRALIHCASSVDTAWEV